MYGGGEVSPQTPSSFHCFACSAAAVCTLRLVSRRWDAVFWSEPSLSLDFRPVLSLPPAEQEQWLAGKLQLLQRVRGMVKSVYLLCSTSEDPCWAKDWAAAAASIQACQQQLQPGIPGLQSLALYWGAVAPLGYFEALLPFSQARVALTLSCFHVPAAATPGLGQLQQLKELAVAHFPREVVPAGGATAALCQLTQLTNLQLGHSLDAGAAGSLAEALPRLGLLRAERVAAMPPGFGRHAACRAAHCSAQRVRRNCGE